MTHFQWRHVDCMNPDDAADLINRYSGVLTLYARQFCEAAEDVVQEVFVAFCQQRIVPANPAGWLFRATRNRAISQRRAEQRRSNHEGKAASARSWFEMSDPAVGIDGQAAELAMGHLPEEQREVIIAHLWGGMSFEEIAHALGGSPATLWRRYRAGIDNLRKLLQPSTKLMKTDGSKNE